MKKLLKLSWVLAFLIASTGAFAQADATHSVGSVHTFKVNTVDADGNHTGNSYTWMVYQADADGNAIDADTPKDGDDVATLDTDYALPGGTNTGVDLNELPIQWLKAGDYLVEVAENNAGTGTCSTLRRIHISVTAGTIDLNVFASKIDGSSETTLTSCNDQSGKIITRGGNDFGKSVRYFAFTMKTDSQDWTGNWGFNYTISETNGSGILSSAVVEAVTADVDASVDGTILVTGNHPLIVLKVTVDNTPGPSDDSHPNAAANGNITLNISATDASPYIVAGGTNAYELTGSANNTLVTPYVITASPNTTDISID